MYNASVDIKKICYALYKVDWKAKHKITAQREMDSLRSYYEYVTTEDIDMTSYTHTDYVQEFGYDGEMYVCFEEFCENEFLDVDYMYLLIGLDNKQLITAYKERLKVDN